MTARRLAPAATLTLLLGAALAGGVTAQDGPRRRARPPAASPREAAPEHPSFTSDIPCSACHTPEGWAMPGGTSGQAGGFDHARTGFPLSGRHLAAGCTDCHAARRQVRRDCVSCHDDAHQGRLGHDCTRCHSSNGWTDTNPLEAHRLTRFPLSGMHAIAACTDCHRRTGDRSFSAVPSTCISCHEADYRRPDVHPIHDGSGGNAAFSPLCETCHRTSGWSPAIADPAGLGSGAMGLAEAAPPRHELRFPIRVGPHQGAPCASCHESPEVPTAVRCAGCHAHAPAQLRIDHRTVRVGPDGRGCLGCHPGGMAR